MGIGSLQGVKLPGRGLNHPPSSKAEVKEKVELYLYSASVSSRQAMIEIDLYSDIPVKKAIYIFNYFFLLSALFFQKMYRIVHRWGYTYSSFFILCIEFHAARMQNKLRRSCPHQVTGWADLLRRIFGNTGRSSSTGDRANRLYRWSDRKRSQVDEAVPVHTKVQFDKLKESEHFADLNPDAEIA